MTTTYYDPDAGSDGSGASHASPRNTTSGVTLSGANTLLQAAGSSRDAAQLGLSGGAGAGSEFVFGAYAPSTGAQIIDGSARAILDGQNAIAFTIFLAASSSHFRVSGVECMNVVGVASAAGIAHSATGGGSNIEISQVHVHHVEATDDSGATGITMPGGAVAAIRDSHVHDIMGPNGCGIRLTGTGSSIERTVIHDTDGDGMFVRCENAVIRGCHVYNVGKDTVTASGDCLQMSSISEPLGAFLVVDNFLDHSSSNQKQTIILEDTLGGTGGLVARNKLLGPRQDLPVLSANAHKTLYIDQDDCMAVQNWITEGERAINIQDTASGVKTGANLVIQTHENSLIAIRHGGGSNGKHANNTLYHADGLGASDGYFNSTAGTTGSEVANSIIVGHKYGVRSDTPTEAHHNCYWNCTTAIANEAGTPQSLDADSFVADPLFFDPAHNDFRIHPHSPCVGAGDPAMLVYFPLDLRGRPYRNPPSLGAYEPQADDIALWRPINGQLWMPQAL